MSRSPPSGDLTHGRQPWTGLLLRPLFEYVPRAPILTHICRPLHSTREKRVLEARSRSARPKIRRSKKHVREALSDARTPTHLIPAAQILAGALPDPALTPAASTWKPSFAIPGEPRINLANIAAPPSLCLKKQLRCLHGCHQICRPPNPITMRPLASAADALTPAPACAYESLPAYALA